MTRLLPALTMIVLTLSLSDRPRAAEPTKSSDADRISVAATDWPWWRGPQRNGVAAANQKPPLKWNETESVVWKSPVPGRGHGSPTVVGDQVFLATAEHDSEIQSLLCLHRQTGKQLWKTDLHQGSFQEVLTKGNKKASLASSTAACDGQRVF
ncbi:MAG: PQQ-binding-like beta-propeller repeat protein, partial [Planctomycetaceae bacterium]|nr:PQQ-binding-like beta-propeller repeat protein [Planctomycetaceae bacterium]